MSNWNDLYHPDLIALVKEIREELGPITPGARPEIVLLRVSHESRSEFQSNLDTDLDWLTWAPETAWVKANVTDVELFRASPAGERLRSRVDMRPIYAPGSKRLIGGWLARGSWIFVFLLSSAAKVDLPRGRNAATEVIKAFLLTVAHPDPHDQAGRPLLRAHALDRILRNESFAWEVYNTLTQTYALVDAAGRPFDALQPNAKDEWTLITFGAARGRDDTARRFLVNRLNRARAGNWPGNEAGLPRGFAAFADPDTTGRMNLEPTDEQRQVRRPRPDPRQRWEVQTIAQVYDQAGVSTFAAAAKLCGQMGVLSRGVDERDQTIDKLSDLVTAGRLLLTPTKIRAYCTGLLAHTETGVTPGQFSPGDRHQLIPRFPGDSLGAVTYDVNVGLPVADGWEWGVEAARWARILQKFWLPAAFVPEGWSWTDPPAEWNWEQILAAAGEHRPTQPRGRNADGGAHRPFSGLLRWEDDGYRHLLCCIANAEDGDRYSWRRELLADARRSGKTGVAYSMRGVDGEVVSSWATPEFHAVWAALALELYRGLLGDEPELAEVRLLPVFDGGLLPAERHAEVFAEHVRTIARIREQATNRRDDADALRLSAARQLRAGNEAPADRYDRQAEEAEAAAGRLEADADRLEANPPEPARPAEPPKADFGTPAAVLAGLTGAYAVGKAPAVFRDALREIGAGDTRLELIDAASVRMTVTVRVRRADGTWATATGNTLLRRSRPHTSTAAGVERRKSSLAALARRWFHEGMDAEELLRLSGAKNQTYARRLVREHLGGVDENGHRRQGAASPLPSQGLLAAISAHPVPAARAAVWCRVHPDASFPVGLTRDWAELVADTYQLDEYWTIRRPELFHHSDHRQDAVTVLSALPDVTAEVPAAHLAELMGVKVTFVTTVSAELLRDRQVVPPTLHRPGGWGGKASGHLPLTDRTVTLFRCPWDDCPSPVVTGVLLLPEVVVGCRTTALCRTCLRPPTRNVRFPDAYRELLDARQERGGAWVSCANGCGVDLGVGPGVLWRWDDTPAAAPTRHTGCTPAALRAAA